MSSTNRSAARDTHISDYYVTPIPSVKDFLAAFTEDLPSLFPDQDWLGSALDVLDPCAGGDEKHPMSYPEALKAFHPPCRVDTIDIRHDSLAANKADYLSLSLPLPEKHDLIITNPPFNIALAVVQKALAEVRPDGLVVMLLRLNFFGTKERKPFFQSTMPVATYVHSRRMKFTNTTGTDSIEYMHAVWQRGNHPKFTQLRVI